MTHLQRLFPTVQKAACPSSVVHLSQARTPHQCGFVFAGTSISFNLGDDLNGGAGVTGNTKVFTQVMIIVPPEAQDPSLPFGFGVWGLEQECRYTEDTPGCAAGTSAAALLGSKVFIFGGLLLADRREYLSNEEVLIANWLCEFDTQSLRFTKHGLKVSNPSLFSQQEFETKGISTSPVMVAEGPILIVLSGWSLEPAATVLAIDTNTMTVALISNHGANAAVRMGVDGVSYLVSGVTNPDTLELQKSSATSESFLYRFFPGPEAVELARPPLRYSCAALLWDSRLYIWGGINPMTNVPLNDLAVLWTGVVNVRVATPMPMDVVLSVQALSNCLPSSTLQSRFTIEAERGGVNGSEGLHDCLPKGIHDSTTSMDGDALQWRFTEDRPWIQLRGKVKAALCEKIHGQSCGSLLHAAQLSLRPSRPSREISFGVRPNIEVIDHVVSGPFTVSTPLTISGPIGRPTGATTHANPWLLCDPQSVFGTTRADMSSTGLPGGYGLMTSCISVDTTTGAASPSHEYVEIKDVHSAPLGIVEGAVNGSSRDFTPGQRFLHCADSAIKLSNQYIVFFSTFDGENPPRTGEGSGGASYALDCTVILQNSTVLFSSAAGGGALATIGGTLILDKATVAFNEATLQGGGISVSCAELIVTESELRYNKVLESSENSEFLGGGAISCVGEKSTRIDASYIIANEVVTMEESNRGARGGGGGIRSTFCSILLNNTIVMNNRAGEGGGGAMLIQSAPLALYHSLIFNNSALGSGGGVYCGRCNYIDCSDSGIHNNTAMVVFGGGANGGPVALSSPLSDSFGGGGMALVHPAGVSRFRNVTFLHNIASEGHGGGLLLAGGGLLSLEGSGDQSPAAANVLLCYRDDAQDNGTEAECFLGVSHDRVRGFNESLDASVYDLIVGAPVVPGGMAFLRNAAPNGGGGGVYFHGTSGVVKGSSAMVSSSGESAMTPDTARLQAPHTALSFNSSSMFFEGNSAMFGPSLGSQVEQLRTNLPDCLQILQYQTLELAIRVELLDAFGELAVSEDKGTVEITAIPLACSDVNVTSMRQQLAASACPGVDVSKASHPSSPSTHLPCDTAAELRGGTIASINGGIATLSGLELREPPSSMVLLRLAVEIGGSSKGNRGVEYRSKELAESALAFPSLTAASLYSKTTALIVAECTPGYVFVPGRGCQPCQAGTFHVEENNTCNTCRDGQFSPASASFCSYCLPGTALKGSGPACGSCGGQLYSGVGWSTCLVCPPGALCQGGTLSLPFGVWVDDTTSSLGAATVDASVVTMSRAYYDFLNMPIAAFPCFPPPLVSLVSAQIPPNTGDPRCFTITGTTFGAAAWQSSQALNFCLVPGQVRDYPLLAASPQAYAWWLLAAASVPAMSTPCNASAMAIAWPPALGLAPSTKQTQWLASMRVHLSSSMWLVNAMQLSPSTVILPCPVESACLLDETHGRIACSPGHMGPLCGVCAPSWASSRLDEPCTPCLRSEGWHTVLIMLYSVGYVAGISVYIWFKTRKLGSREATSHPTEGSEAGNPFVWRCASCDRNGFKRCYKQNTRHCASHRDSLVRTLLTFLQSNYILSAIVPRRAAVVTLSFFPSLPSLDALSFRCVFSLTYLQRLIMFSALAPVAAIIVGTAILALLGAKAVLQRVRRRDTASKDSNEDGNRHRSKPTEPSMPLRRRRSTSFLGRFARYFRPGLVLVLFLFHPSITQAVLEAFDVYPHVLQGHQRLRTDLTIHLTSPTYSSILALALVDVLVLVLGIPVMGILILRRHRHELKSLKIKAAYGFLYNGYSQNNWYWEGVAIIRKALLQLVVVMFQDDMWRVSGAALVLAVGLVIHVLRQPFDSSFLNVLESASLTILTLHAVAAAMTVAAQVTPEAVLVPSPALSVGLQVLFAAVCIALIAVIVGFCKGKPAISPRPSWLQQDFELKPKAAEPTASVSDTVSHESLSLILSPALTAHTSPVGGTVRSMRDLRSRMNRQRLAFAHKDQ